MKGLLYRHPYVAGNFIRTQRSRTRGLRGAVGPPSGLQNPSIPLAPPPRWRRAGCGPFPQAGGFVSPAFQESCPRGCAEARSGVQEVQEARGRLKQFLPESGTQSSQSPFPGARRAEFPDHLPWPQTTAGLLPQVGPGLALLRALHDQRMGAELTVLVGVLRGSPGRPARPA